MTGTRQPPNNLAAERGLLGAMMLKREARDAALECLDAEDFYRPSHGHIFDAIGTLSRQGHDAEPVAVADHLLREGLAVDLVELIGIQADAPPSSTIGTFVDIVAKYARQRRILAWAGEAIEAVYNGHDPAPAVAQLGNVVATTGDLPSSWMAVDLTPFLEGDITLPEPAWLCRTDGAPLLYAGKVHAFNGESESGKSWLACVAVYEAVLAGRECLYVDFEDDHLTFIDRMRSLGADMPEIQRVSYVRPDEPFDDRARLALRNLLEAHSFAVAVLDGVAEALTQNGWDENKATDVTAFYAVLPRPIARAGAAVVLIDHVVKDREQQGRYGRGSTAKLNGIDGAVYKVETITHFGRGRTGRARVLVNKDRVGWVRKTAGGQKLLAEMTLESHGDGSRVTATLSAPEPGDWQPSFYMEKVSRALEGMTEPLSTAQVQRIVPGKQQVVISALQALVTHGFAEARPGPRNAVLYVSLQPYREEINED